MKVLITGGSGFIGTNLINYLFELGGFEIVNIDLQTYASTQENFDGHDDNYSIEKYDICNKNKISEIIGDYKPEKVLHLAAESHVDRSIENPDSFIHTNILGTYNLLNCSYDYYKNLENSAKKIFRFHHVSTDEVYGSLGPVGLFTEKSPYKPNSPYSASKASSDHLVRAWYETYSFPTIISNCSNNFGPFQNPEKFIPKTILSLLKGKNITIYGDGLQIRDWLHVKDHSKAISAIFRKGEVGETYNIGANNERSNLEIVQIIHCKLKSLGLIEDDEDFSERIEFVEDRLGHDVRYAIDNQKITKNLGWKPDEHFEDAIYDVIKWYSDNDAWCNKVLEAQ